MTLPSSPRSPLIFSRSSSSSSEKNCWNCSLVISASCPGSPLVPSSPRGPGGPGGPLNSSLLMTSSLISFMTLPFMITFTNFFCSSSLMLPEGCISFMDFTTKSFKSFTSFKPKSFLTISNIWLSLRIDFFILFMSKFLITSF